MSCTKCGTSNTACGCKDSPYTTPVPVTCQPDATCPTPSKCSEYMDAACVYLQDGIHDADLPPLTSVEEAIQQLTLMITNPSCTNTDSCNCGGGSSIELQVNGTDNTDQTILNLVDGNNIAITDEGNGEIKITNTYVPINLPVPKVLFKGTSQITQFEYFTNTQPGKTWTLLRTPIVSVTDISQEMIDAYPIFVEMVFYKQNRKGKAFVAPPSYTYNGGSAVNDLQQALGNPALKTRGGLHYRKKIGIIPAQYELIKTDRPNHYRVTSVNQQVNVHEYLNGWFDQISVEYITVGGGEDTFLAPAAFPRVGNASNNGYAIQGYGSDFKPLYLAYRYIAWDENANNGLGDFISGPLSETIAVGTDVFPLMRQTVGAYQVPAEHLINPRYLDDVLTCWFVHRK